MARKTLILLAVIIGFVLSAGPVLPCHKTAFGPKEHAVGWLRLHSSLQSFKVAQAGEGLIEISKVSAKSKIYNGFVILNNQFISLYPILSGKASKMQASVQLQKRNYLLVFLYGKKGAAIKIKIRKADQGTTNREPVADSLAVTTDEDTPLSIALAGSDPDGDPLSFQILSQPSNGTLSGAAPALNYTPAADYNGPDSFTFKVNDGKVDSQPATVKITVNPVNDPPVASAEVPSSAFVGDTVSLVGSGSDVDGDTLTYQWSFTATPGGTSPAIDGADSASASFVPLAQGDYELQLVVSDGTTDSEPVTATVSVTYPPLTLKEDKLMPKDESAGAGFGSSVSMDNSRAIIGAGARGAAYIFDHSSPWTETKKLSGEAADFFGASVAVSGDSAVVGAYGTDTSQDVWVQIFGEDEYAAPPGEDVFWVPATNEWGSNFNAFSILTAGDWPRNLMAKKLRLGFSVRRISLTVYDESGNVLGSSSSYTPSSELVLNPDSDIARIAVSGTLRINNTEFLVSTGGPGAGAAYVFERDGLDWSQPIKLTASDGKEGDAFGISVAISDHVILAGADMADADSADSGAAYVFVRGESGWAENAKLEGSEAGSRFGASVSVSGDVAMVGAPGAERAYLFLRNGDAWNPEPVLFAKDGIPGDLFGTSVAVSGNVAVVGAPVAEAAYVFWYDGLNWVQQAKLFAEDEQSGNLFGASVSISGDRIVVGAPGTDGSGALYVFKFDGSGWISKGKVTPADEDRPAGQEFGASVSISGKVILVGAMGDDENGAKAGAAYAYTIETD